MSVYAKKVGGSFSAMDGMIAKMSKALCEPKRKLGRYAKSVYQAVPYPMHDSAWDGLMRSSKTLKIAFTHIPDMFWKYSRNVKVAGVKKRCGLRDQVFGADLTNYKEVKTVGQRQAVKDIKSGKTTVLQYMKAYFSLASGNPKKQFGKMERIVGQDDVSLLGKIKGVISIADPAKLVRAVEEIKRAAVKYGTADTTKATEGLADAATLLAAAAAQKLAKYKKNTKCNLRGNPVYKEGAEFWLKKAFLWAKVARRLAHGNKALQFEKGSITRDPLFTKGRSGFTCKASPLPPTIRSAIEYFNVSGTHLYVSATVKAFLAGSWQDAFSCSGRYMQRRKTTTTPILRCERSEIKMRVRGNFVCRPKSCLPGRYPNKKCRQKPGMRPTRPIPVRPGPMSGNMAAEGGFLL